MSGSLDWLGCDFWFDFDSKPSKSLDCFICHGSLLVDGVSWKPLYVNPFDTACKIFGIAILICPFVTPESARDWKNF